ncbi:MAG TPA: N-acetyltransferase [Ktedonobacteraceae bacterium]|nr:N-acetyltransferase [Ktedonobacteraceae bacterium]
MDTTNMIIRPEQVNDYSEIALLNVRAFGNRTVEAIIVALHRQRRVFDPELSLVAEINGRIVGHVLFSPHQIRLLNQAMHVVNLAPIAVDPAFQGQGIGGQLIAKGHRIAAAKGYRMSVLLGHPTYYPRFGYHTHAYGVAKLAISIDALSEELLETRNPTSEDVPLLYDLWQREEGAVDMVFEPDRDLLDWLSPNPPYEQRSIYATTRWLATRALIAESQQSLGPFSHKMTRRHERWSLRCTANGERMQREQNIFSRCILSRPRHRHLVRQMQPANHGQQAWHTHWVPAHSMTTWRRCVLGNVRRDAQSGLWRLILINSTLPF